MYETRAYDKTNDDGFPPDPVAIVVATGTWDVSRLMNALVRGNTETGKVAELLRRKVNRHYGGRAALALLKRHGGPDLTALKPDATDPDGVGYWGSTEAHFVSAGPDGQVDLSFAGSPQIDPVEARRLAEQLWAAADWAERAEAPATTKAGV